MKLAGWFDKQEKPYGTLVIGLILIAVVGLIDWQIGYEIGFSVFYVLPIALVTWYTNSYFGFAASVLSALAWAAADLATGHVYSSTLIPVWNALIRVLFFVLITMLLAALRQALRREAELARIDYLTGAYNSRFFYELTQMELQRFQRYRRPFTMAYIDLDNFKTVNDQFGHSIGDQVLRMVVSTIKSHIRRTDILSRLGGDEFALLLPETGQESARIVLSSIQISMLEKMQDNRWPVTFSIGVITCQVAPSTIDEIVKIADELMYQVKGEGKNAVKFSVYTG